MLHLAGKGSTTTTQDDDSVDTLINSATTLLGLSKEGMIRNLERDQTLTATHDNAAAWAGIGSAVFQLWNQKVVPASIIGISAVFLYLSNILVLHITTPALFSLETFNSSRLVGVGTEGLPAYNWLNNPLDDALGEDLETYTLGSLYFLPSVVAPNATSLGLYEGTLYDVLKVPAGTGNVTVNATGFNISCGYLADFPLPYQLHDPSDSSVGAWGTDNFFITTTEGGIISTLAPGTVSSSIQLYSTIPIVDSDNNEGPSVQLIPPMNTSVSSVQLLQCSQSLVNQTAVVDSQSGKIIPGTVFPGIEKTNSNWMPRSRAGPLAWDIPADPQNTSSGNVFLDTWGLWYSHMPSTDFPRNPRAVARGTIDMLSFADLYLIQKLNLRPANQDHPPANVTLHQLENALSILVASMFWTLGHIPPTHNALLYNASSGYTTFKPTPPPFLLQGDATVTEILTQIRLDITAGLVASIALMLLSLPSSLVRRGAKDGENIAINGTGILHAIWLYRNHPELQTLLEQVDHPTNENLRDAGLVRIKLVGEQVRKQDFESF
ncbi:hypothetical protein C8R44DRAFT_783835 [Mycena epipterygia]|nr:hypothetical protein C8R44DRAFT_783835 [Mycena epipterygia]